MSPPLRIAFVPGVTITKWSRIWSERRPETALEFVPVAQGEAKPVLDADADLVFVRLPVDESELSVIRLYSEEHVVVASADHHFADVDEVSLSDLDGLTVHDPLAPIDDTIALIAAGVGVVVVPHAIARANNRKDLVSRPIVDAERTEIAIAWISDRETSDIEEFVGIVRGRSANSSRAVPTPPTEKPAPGKAGSVARASKGDAKNTGGKAKSKRKPYATSGGADPKNRSGSPNSPKARNARKRKGK